MTRIEALGIIVTVLIVVGAFSVVIYTFAVPSKLIYVVTHKGVELERHFRHCYRNEGCVFCEDETRGEMYCGDETTWVRYRK